MPEQNENLETEETTSDDTEEKTDNENIDDNDRQENINKTEKRIKDLSEKVRLTAEERDEKDKLVSKLEKENGFYKNFSQITSKYSAAAEYEEQIKEKVMAGYEPEDAAVAVLAKENKLGLQGKPKESPAGGSATNTITAGAEKSVGDMTQEERRKELSNREGDLLKIFNQNV